MSTKYSVFYIFHGRLKKVNKFVGDWLVSVPKHLALDVHGVQLALVVLGDDLHYILLLKGIFIHPLHGTHTLDGDGGAHLQQINHNTPINTSMQAGEDGFCLRWCALRK